MTDLTVIYIRLAKGETIEAGQILYRPALMMAGKQIKIVVSSVIGVYGTIARVWGRQELVKL